MGLWNNISLPSTKNISVDVPSTKNIDVDTTNIDGIDGGNSFTRNANTSSFSAQQAIEIDNIKKLESPEMTARYGDTVSQSSFYKKNKTKLAAYGLTLGAIAGWYGTLLAKGYSPAEAWEKKERNVHRRSGRGSLCRPKRPLGNNCHDGARVGGTQSVR